MGDYTKFIVNCSVKKLDDEGAEILEGDIRSKLSMLTSAYHCGGELVNISNDWHHRTDISIITQCKYGNGILQFIEWLKPQVTQGFGESEIFAMEISEYCTEPTLYCMESINDD
jgi:hypothetical protein